MVYKLQRIQKDPRFDRNADASLSRGNVFRFSLFLVLLFAPSTFQESKGKFRATWIFFSWQLEECAVDVANKEAPPAAIESVQVVLQQGLEVPWRLSMAL